jgi:hypothetical protein
MNPGSSRANPLTTDSSAVRSTTRVRQSQSRTITAVRPLVGPIDPLLTTGVAETLPGKVLYAMGTLLPINKSRFDELGGQLSL